MQMRFQNPTPECLSHMFVITQVCSIQLFSTQVSFHSAILQIDVIQCRCLPQVCFLHIRADVFFTGLLLCRYVPHRYFFIRDSPSESPRQECLIPGCLYHPCVSTPVRSYRCPRNTGENLRLHLPASAPFYSSPL